MTTQSSPESGNSPYGQYASDYANGLGGSRLGADPSGQLAARGNGSLLLHNQGLFDETGSIPDEATGHPAGDSLDALARNGMRIIDLTESDQLLRDPGDTDTDAWLRRHDHGQYGRSVL